MLLNGGGLAVYVRSGRSSYRVLTLLRISCHMVYFHATFVPYNVHLSNYYFLYYYKCYLILIFDEPICMHLKQLCIVRFARGWGACPLSFTPLVEADPQWRCKMFSFCCLTPTEGWKFPCWISPLSHCFFVKIENFCGCASETWIWYLSRILHPSEPPLDIGSTYTALRESIIQCELFLLRALGFQVSIDHPHKVVRSG